MITSDEGIKLIKHYEGLRLQSYQDSVGVWTIGYGHTGRGVGPGQTIDEHEAESLLRHDLLAAEHCVNAHVRVNIDQHQFDALVSFVFNLGCGAFLSSTLLRKLNAGDYEGAHDEFHKWCHAGKRVLRGLVDRRQAEAEEFGTSPRANA